MCTQSITYIHKQIIYWWRCRPSSVSMPFFPACSAGCVSHHSLAEPSFHPSDIFFLQFILSHTTAASMPCIFSRTRLLLCGLNVPPSFSRNLTPGDELFINQASGVMSRCDRSPNHTLTSFWGGKALYFLLIISTFPHFCLFHPGDRCIKVINLFMYHSRSVQTPDL